MANPFTARRPWAAALIALVFGPFVAMLYLGRGWWALFYVLLEILAVAAGVVVLAHVLTRDDFSSGVDGIEFAIRLVGVVQSFVMARRSEPGRPAVWYARWYAIAGIVIVFLAAAFGTRTFLYQPFWAPSASMQPTLRVGDYMFANKYVYRAGAPERGDVVVFRAIRNQGTFVKRIIGLPGDRIELRNSVVYINGVAVPRRDLGPGIDPCEDLSPCKAELFEETLPGGRRYRVFNAASDGPFENVPGIVVPPDHYFVLGDNRDNSMDSRMPDVGTVARADIQGRIGVKFFTNGDWTWQAVR